MWDFVNDIRKEADRRQLALKWRLSATAKEPAASDLRRGELAMAHMNPQSAFGMADVKVGISVDSAMMGRSPRGVKRSLFRQRRCRNGGPRRGDGKGGGKSLIARRR